MGPESIYTHIQAVWINESDIKLTLILPGVTDPVHIDPGATSGLTKPGIDTMNILTVNSSLQSGASNDLFILFVGDVQLPSAIYQQVERTAPWEPVEIDEKPALHHFQFTLEAGQDGLVIVGTVELIETVPTAG